MFFETILTRDQIQEFVAVGLWPDATLARYVQQAVSAMPDKDALVDVHGRYRYRELAALVDACALGLIDLGVRRGDVVAVQLPNWKEFVVLMLALERIGAVMNPVAPIFRQRELRVMLRLAQPVAMVIPASFRGFDYQEMIAGLRSAAPSLRTVVVLGGRPGPGMTSWDALVEQGRSSKWGPEVLALLQPDPNEVAELMFTSGTTGEPKGVLHTHNTMLAATQAMIRALRLTSADVLHMASTVAHQSGYLYGVRMALHLGATCVLQDIWDPEQFVELIERERITVSCGATPFLADTVRAARAGRHDLSSFRFFGCFGAPIPRPLLDEAKAVLPCRVMPGWGMTEVALLTTTSPDDPDEKVVGSDGKAVPGTAVRVVDDAGVPLPAGSEGNLQCRGCTAFAGYLQGRTFTEQFFTADGWFETGDRAIMDADGFIRISGRTKDLIIRGGENIPVKEIEDIIISHPNVRNVALVAVPDARLGEVACACLICEEGAPLTLDQLRTFLAEKQVTRQFWPERVEVFSEFPMTPSGKVQKFQLRQLLQPQTTGTAG
jgi:cyclohexanecarboxylate-CoA ligase